MVQHGKLRPVLSRVVQGLFFAAFCWVYFSVIITNSGSMPWLSVLLGAGFLAAGIGAAYFCNKIAVKWKPKTIHLIFGGISVLMFGLLLYVGLSLKAIYTWDINLIYKMAAYPHHESGYYNISYLAACPNNIFYI